MSIPVPEEFLLKDPTINDFATKVIKRTAWREQMVELDGETIEQAAGEFNRYRTAPILIGDTRLSALRIGGRFRITRPVCPPCGDESLGGPSPSGPSS